MNKNGWGITISCDDCRMQSTSACDDCVVSFLLRDDEEQVEQTPLVLEARGDSNEDAFRASFDRADGLREQAGDSLHSAHRARRAGLT